MAAPMPMVATMVIMFPHGGVVVVVDVDVVENR